MPIGDGDSSSNQARHDYVQRGVRVGFLTDPTLCIGCKACEVACKEWNGVPDDGYRFTGNSYDNTGQLSGSTWRHVKFLELDQSLGPQIAGPMGSQGDEGSSGFGWLFSSDVCKHCEVAGCLEACPTGAIVRNEVGAVYVQDDVCNGCGYCVVGCPFGVIDRRPQGLPGAGGAYKCTFCYDRQIDGLTPACAKACPTESIAFGPLSELEKRAKARVDTLRGRGFDRVRVYDARNTSVRGAHALLITLGNPERLGLPRRPEVPTTYQPSAWTAAVFTAALAIAGAFAAFFAAPGSDEPPTSARAAEALR
jgi:formate dehydrogenase iron-sulfur subunit